MSVELEAIIVLGMFSLFCIAIIIAFGEGLDDK